ncbi:MAG: PLP-dependent aminotransferase family protein [Acidobacteria bacterium]|nr:PLP-dependent aminotransferase family protein [Acidobacteriota bacterium]
MLLLKLDKGSCAPVYRQIVGQIRDLVDRDVLAPGDALPSTRILAEKLGVNRSTVYNAYQELWALGYLESRPGSYTRVRRRMRIATPETRADQGLIDWEAVSTPAGADVYRTFLDYRPEYRVTAAENIINLSQLDLDPRLFPADEFRKCINLALLHRGPKILGYGEYAGYAPLRETIAQRMRTHGVALTADEILITNGSQNGIDLLLKMLVVPGTPVVVESPTYANVIPLLRYYQARIIPVPIQADGLDLSRLEKIFQAEHPAFVYTIPNFQNPTGITTSQAHREALLALCEWFRVPIVEDGFEEEMKYYGKVTLPIKSMDRQQMVIYLGTFSKVLFPGVRVGWIAAEKECIRRLTALKRFCDLTSSPVVQASLYEFCRLGHYDRHIQRMHRVFRKRMQVAVSAMRAHIPVDCGEWVEPVGGYLVWLHLKKPVPDEQTLEGIFRRHGVLMSPGKRYFPEMRPRPFFRISISMLDEEEIATGIRRLGRAVREICGRSE